MHPVSFAMKRMFLCSVAINRSWTRLYHLTPARFDLMVAIAARRIRMPQLSVRRQLGVRSPTVSRLLNALEERGWVIREIDPRDRRRRLLTLTRKGRAILDVARGDLTLGPIGELVARQTVSSHFNDRTVTERSLAEVRATFGRIRTLQGDTATFRYPPYRASGERSPLHPVPYYGEHPSWLPPP